MTDAVAAWRTEHRYFERLLDLLEKEIEVFHGGERPNYELMLDILHYLRHYSDQFHHPREDAAFERLAQRAPEIRPMLRRLEQEHRVIAQAGEQLLQYLNEVIAGGMVPRADIETAAATYLVYYRSHIANEEKTVLPRAQALSPQDWEAARAALPTGRDPLFGGEPEERYRELRRRIALEA